MGFFTSRDNLKLRILPNRFKAAVFSPALTLNRKDQPDFSEFVPTPLPTPTPLPFPTNWADTYIWNDSNSWLEANLTSNWGDGIIWNDEVAWSETNT